MYKFNKDKLNSSFKVIDIALTPMRLFIFIAAAFVVVGMAVVFFPKLFALIVGGFLFFIGTIFALLAWKFYSFKKKIEKTFQEAQTNPQVVISSVNYQDKNMTESEVLEAEISKKITWH